jgi:Fe-S oxidoreductase
MRSFSKMTSAIFAGAFALSACAHAANEPGEASALEMEHAGQVRHLEAHVSQMEALSEKQRVEMIKEIKAELASAMHEVRAAADDLAIAQVEMTRAKAEVAELNLGVQMRSEMVRGHRQALNEIKEAKRELALAKMEIARAAMEVKKAMAEEMGEPMPLAPQSDEVID